LEGSHGHADFLGFSVVVHPHLHRVTTNKTHVLEATISIIIVACRIGLYRVEVIDVDTYMVVVDVVELDV
jgi:hypothetical protein